VEAVLPDEVRRLPVELERVDRLLDDEVFFGPFVPFFHPRNALVRHCWSSRGASRYGRRRIICRDFQ